MVVVDGQGIPLGGTLASASPAEVTLVDQSLEQIKVSRNGRGRPRSLPKPLSADKGYDSDKLRKSLKKRRVEAVMKLLLYFDYKKRSSYQLP